MVYKVTRKIIRVGTTSYGVVLPMTWIRYHGLNDKDSVEIITADDITIRKFRGS